MESIFKKQDLFLTQMRKDYTAGNIPHSDIFKPYFEWKNGGTLITSAITKDEAIAIMWHTRELLEQFFMTCILTPTRIFRHITVMTHGKNIPGMGKINTT